MHQTDPISWQLHNIEIEQALLGCILMHNSAYTFAIKHVTHEHFFEPIHQTIFETCVQLIEAGKRADPLILSTFIPNDVLSPGMSAKKYLIKLAVDSVGVIAAEDYARQVRELADRRKLAQIAYGLMPADASAASGLAAVAIEELDSIIVADRSGGLLGAPIGDVMTRTVDKIALAYQHDGKIMGVTTGLRDLDAKLGGLGRGNLVVLAGRPGMGKSAVVLNIVRQAARHNNRSLVFSKEMPSEELGERMISDYLFDIPAGKVPYNSLRNGNFHERMFHYVKEAALANSQLPIDIEEQSGLTMSQIATRARRYKRRHGRLDILVVDHLDLIKPSGRYQGNKVYELGEITAAAKALAKELDCVFILLSQLSREVEKREDKRPVLADLRSSGSIEQDADVVIFLYRPSYYLGQQDPTPGTPEYEKWMDDSEKAHNKLVAIVAKQRMGPTGSIDLFCDIANNAVRDLGAGERP